MLPPPDLDNLSAAELKRLVLALSARIGELERATQAKPAGETLLSEFENTPEAQKAHEQVERLLSYITSPEAQEAHEQVRRLLSDITPPEPQEAHEQVERLLSDITSPEAQEAVRRALSDITPPEAQEAMRRVLSNIIPPEAQEAVKKWLATQEAMRRVLSTEAQEAVRRVLSDITPPEAQEAVKKWLAAQEAVRRVLLNITSPEAQEAVKKWLSAQEAVRRALSDTTSPNTQEAVKYWLTTRSTPRRGPFWTTPTTNAPRGAIWYAIFVTLFVAIMAGILLALLGLGYRGLRFLANYEESRVTVTDCKSALVTIDPEDAPQWRFIISTDKIPYPISKLEDASIRDIYGGKAVPTTNWCERYKRGDTISVLHFDKLQVAIPYEGDKPNLYWLLYYVFGAEWAGSVAILPILTLIGVFGVAALGLAYGVYNIVIILPSVKREATKGIMSTILYIGHLVKLAAVLALGFIFFVGLSLTVWKGLLYVENGNSLLMGTCVLVPLALVAFGPTMIIKAIYWMQTDELSVIIRELVAVSALGPPAYRMWNFLFREDQFSFESLGDLMEEVFIHHLLGWG
jgi:hypothetical protein